MPNMVISKLHIATDQGYFKVVHDCDFFVPKFSYFACYRVLQLSQANSQLLIEQEKLVFASKEKDSLISSLRYEVTSKSNEKKLW